MWLLRNWASGEYVANAYKGARARASTRWVFHRPVVAVQITLKQTIICTSDYIRGHIIHVRPPHGTISAAIKSIKILGVSARTENTLKRKTISHYLNFQLHKPHLWSTQYPVNTNGFPIHSMYFTNSPFFFFLLKISCYTISFTVLTSKASSNITITEIS